MNRAEDIYKLDDWRIMGQPGYLFKKRIRYTQVENILQPTEHRHCEFCFDRFSHNNNDLQSGYICCVQNKTYWICENCYIDFKDLFHWKVVETE